MPPVSACLVTHTAALRLAWHCCLPRACPGWRRAAPGGRSSAALWKRNRSSTTPAARACSAAHALTARMPPVKPLFSCARRPSQPARRTLARPDCSLLPPAAHAYRGRQQRDPTCCPHPPHRRAVAYHALRRQLVPQSRHVPGVWRLQACCAARAALRLPAPSPLCCRRCAAPHRPR